ncbi:MAG: amylo-alpha-1,6-glucosidase [Planctomycetota bacterium]|nr:amylo-alpha-1,6-glucosidase [Planctomycetota bacterium]
MNRRDSRLIDRAKDAAIEVLLHNAHGPCRGLPRAAGWGYPEPYTRDLMISSLGVLVSGNEKLVKSLRRTLEVLAKNQSRLGHIPSLVHDPEDRGASDCTPLFLMAVGIFRQVTGEQDFLEEPVQRAMKWMEYQSPTARVTVAQLPTSDWRDEQWVVGYGLYVNTIVYTYLRLFGQESRACELREAMDRFTVKGERQQRHVHEGLVLRRKPYYAMWSYKVHRSERFDLLGNSLAILTGIASPSRARRLTSWIETECEAMRKNKDLSVELPPNFFPYVRPDDPDWMPRYKKYNQPGEYHNGGVWPFVCGFYVAALVAAGKYALAEKKLATLAELVRPAREAKVEFGFNEWLRAQDGSPQGEDWQSWSAAMYLYAATCVEQKRTPFFEEIRRP